MRRIFKYVIPSDYPGKSQISVPSHSRILSIQNQRGTIALWAEVFPNHKMEEMEFLLLFTGEEEPSSLFYKYHSTIQMEDSHVIHVYQKIT